MSSESTRPIFENGRVVQKLGDVLVDHEFIRRWSCDTSTNPRTGRRILKGSTTWSKLYAQYHSEKTKQLQLEFWRPREAEYEEIAQVFMEADTLEKAREIENNRVVCPDLRRPLHAIECRNLTNQNYIRLHASRMLLSFMPTELLNFVVVYAFGDYDYSADQLFVDFTSKQLKTFDARAAKVDKRVMQLYGPGTSEVLPRSQAYDHRGPISISGFLARYTSDGVCAWIKKGKNAVCCARAKNLARPAFEQRCVKHISMIADQSKKFRDVDVIPLCRQFDYLTRELCSRSVSNADTCVYHFMLITRSKNFAFRKLAMKSLPQLFIRLSSEAEARECRDAILVKFTGLGAIVIDVKPPGRIYECQRYCRLTASNFELLATKPGDFQIFDPRCVDVILE